MVQKAKKEKAEAGYTGERLVVDPHQGLLVQLQRDLLNYLGILPPLMGLLKWRLHLFMMVKLLDLSQWIQKYWPKVVVYFNTVSAIGPTFHRLKIREGDQK